MEFTALAVADDTDASRISILAFSSDPQQFVDPSVAFNGGIEFAGSHIAGHFTCSSEFADT
jgi:hypothetical protein